ncbi:hypothetical protein [Bradyrhizobium sp.]|uniref:hypothetical protein n=1 Tax=Bradyrhizobium sp. TaxID=376 RepID=UPI003C7131C8
MNENIKPVESLTVADFEAHPVWEFLNDDEIGETFVEPVKIPVKCLANRVLGAQVRLANGLQVWALIGNFDVTNPRATQHFLTLSIERSGKWFYLARYHDIGSTVDGPEALARFLGLGVDDVFPISVDVRRYVQGDPKALTATVLREPREKLTDAELTAMVFRKSNPNSA